MRVTSFLAVATTAALASPTPFDHLKQKRQSTTSNTSLEVDLGYSVYQGVSNQTTGVNSWKGIRFAAAPIDTLRWQAPKVPELNRTSGSIQADTYGSQCPQSFLSAEPYAANPGLLASEDCLFLNVFAPANAENLPVFVWIHGGGYGLGNAQSDMSDLIMANNNGFIAVNIQYRLGAFGFLSSDEVGRNGAVNAGLLDQHFALQWVQSYIESFGGNASMVTVAGESAGGGAVMLQTMAYGGSLGESLFTNAIASSPYLPMQYGYKDWVPSQAYYAFAAQAGCLPGTAYGSATTIFECLVSKDTTTLQNASFNVSASGTYGSWGFLPVTDGVFIQDVPSQQLLEKRVNGKNLLVGNNANEGVLFVPQLIATEEDLLAWLQLTFPLFTNDDISKILLYYPISNVSDTEYATSGIGGASALDVSSVATGQQQRANNIYAETTFVCPSYWMAEAFTDKGRTAYKYQFSAGAAQHGADVSVFMGASGVSIGADFELAFQSIWGDFVTTSNPSISNEIANGASSNSSATNPASDWPAYSINAPYMMNLNQTGGTQFENTVFPGVNATESMGPGLMNDITLVNAYTWEAGRGFRCDFWRSVAAIVPE